MSMGERIARVISSRALLANTLAASISAKIVYIQQFPWIIENEFVDIRKNLFLTDTKKKRAIHFLFFCKDKCFNKSIYRYRKIVTNAYFDDEKET